MICIVATDAEASEAEPIKKRVRMKRIPVNENADEAKV
jgi:hypothetical protein